MIRRALITGAGGFVCGHIARGLADAGLTVRALDRSFDAAARHGLAGCELVELDLAERAPDLGDVDLVIHGAALTTSPAKAGLTVAQHVAANLQPLLAVLSAVERSRPAALVFLSSSGVFGPGDGSDALRDEDEPTGQGPYAEAKRLGERLTLSRLFGDTACHVVRLGHLYGPGERPRPSRTHVSNVARWIAAAASGGPLDVPSDDPARDWTWTLDLGPALLRLVEGAPAGRPLHLTSGAVRHDRAMVATIAARFPGARIVDVAPAPTKPPMAPSLIPALDGFAWTSPEAGIDRLATAAVPA